MNTTSTTFNWQTINNYVVLGGSAVIAVSAAFQLTKVKSLKEAALPIVFLLTGIAAFNCAIQAKGSTPAVANS